MIILSVTQPVFSEHILNSLSKHFASAISVTDLCVDIEDTIMTCHVSGLRNIEMDDIAFVL